MSNEQDNLSGEEIDQNQEQFQGQSSAQLAQQRAANQPQLDEIVKGLQQQNSQQQQQAKKYQLKDMDLNSVFVNNLEENTSEDDIREYFRDCGVIEKITMRPDKITGLLFCYIQFNNTNSVEDAILLSEGMIRGRKIKVYQKRTNLRSFRGGTRGRAMNIGGGMQFRSRYIYAPQIRGRGGQYRGRYM